MTLRLARALGLGLGALADAKIPDPATGHPVALFGQWAAKHEASVYDDSVTAGAGFVASTVMPMWWVARRVERHAAEAPLGRTAVVALATWTVLGQRGLHAAARSVQHALEAGDLPAAREGLRSLCARDPSALSADEIARAVVESVAENTSDAVVAPLLWGAATGTGGLVAYRAVNTLDAMVGYRNERYARFGTAAARLDDVANWLPARITAALTCALAPTVGGSRRSAMAAWQRDGAKHPSPNAGHCEAAFAGALGVRLGGSNTYPGYVDKRPTLGNGAPVAVADIDRAIRLSSAVSRAALVVAVGLCLRPGR